MLADVFDQNNCIVVNCKAAAALGLVTAAYLSVLIGSYQRAVKKKKLLDGDYFKVDRKHIKEATGLTQSDQLSCEGDLIQASILRKSPDDPDAIKLDLNVYISLVSSEDVSIVKDLRSVMRATKSTNAKESRRHAEIESLKSSITCSNYELLTALRDWVEGVYARPNGFLSKKAIRIFQDTLNDYTKGDLDVALEIVKIATIQGYRDCTWAINTYEKDHPKKKVNSRGVRVSDGRVATREDLSDKIF